MIATLKKLFYYCIKFSEVQMKESLDLPSQHPDPLWYEQAQSICLHCTSSRYIAELHLKPIVSPILITLISNLAL